MRGLILTFIVLVWSNLSFGQQDSLVVKDSTIYRVISHDGIEYVGYIVSQDAHEVLLKTKERGPIYIPQYIIKDIAIVNLSEYNEDGEYIGEDIFATRYFITTNGLPIKKGEHYIQWNWFGPDFQFGVGKNFGVGVMTSWLALPIIATAKYTMKLGDNSQLAFGALAGTSSWLAMTEDDLNVGGVLPFTTLSFGNRRSNIAFSGGYGALWYNNDAEGRALASIAGMYKVGRKFSIVFDSFIMFPGKTRTVTDTYYEYDPVTMTNVLVTTSEEKPGSFIALFIPGLRWHQSANRAFQFGFTGLVFEDEIIPFPLPMVQWYRKL